MIRRCLRRAAAVCCIALTAGAGITVTSIHAHSAADSSAASASAPSAASASPPRTPLTLPQLLHPLTLFPLPTSPPPFLCENWSYLRVSIPQAFVLDGVCDCCDGSDERVKEGEHPFLSSLGKKEEKPAEGGWFSSLLAPTKQPAAASSQTNTHCPNTCSTQAAKFLSSLQTKLASYQRAYSTKVEMLQHDLPIVGQKITDDMHVAAEVFNVAVEDWKQTKEKHEEAVGELNEWRDRKEEEKRVEKEKTVDANAATTGQQPAVDTPPEEPELDAEGSLLLSRAQTTHSVHQTSGQLAGAHQFTLEQVQYLLGQPVPAPHDRSVQRQPGWFGPYHEWLLFYQQCFSYAWPQRRFGAFGEHVDWYEMKLCPLHNATQQAMVKVPKREGSRWKEDEEGEEVAASSSIDSSTNTTEHVPEPPQIYILGHWVGDIFNDTMQARFAAANGGANSATSAATTTPSGKSKSSSPLAPGGSVLSTTAPPSYTSRFRGGATCWQVGPRQVDVKYVCGAENELIEIRENGKCKYEFVMQTPIACEKEYATLLQQQMNQHKRWFGRTKPKVKEVKTKEEMMRGHEEL